MGQQNATLRTPITLFNGVKYEKEAHENIFVETHSIMVPKDCFQEKSH